MKPLAVAVAVLVARGRLIRSPARPLLALLTVKGTARRELGFQKAMSWKEVISSAISCFNQAFINVFKFCFNIFSGN